MKKLNIHIFIFILILNAFVAILYSKHKVIFPHVPHIENDVECKACHPSVLKSMKAKDSNLPPDNKVCVEECHDSDILKGLKYLKSSPKYGLENNHQIHIDQDVPCKTCHEKIFKKSFTPGSAFPEMSVCFECHENETAPKTCTLCHVEKIPFFHKVHIENDLECDNCHSKIGKSTKIDRGRDLPGKESCKECHDEKDRYTDVTLFSYERPSAEKEKTDRPYKIEFNHSLHIEMDSKCKDCHREIEKDKFIPGKTYPQMSICFECHDNSSAPKKCTLCHLNKVPFLHKFHMEKGQKCDGCHKKISKSTKTDRGKSIPGKESCNECHEEKDLYPDVTVFRHKKQSGVKKILNSILNFFKSEKPVSRYRIEFNHSLHIEMDSGCKDCHKEIEKDKLIPGKTYPQMSICFECHDNSSAPKTCTLCHEEKVQFPHKTHIDNDLECDGCHKDIAVSTNTDGGRDIPGKESCKECHDEKDRYPDVTLFPYKQIYLFNHKLHTGEQGLECKECHMQLYRKNILKRSEIVVKMDYCFECHDNSTATKYCMLCHINPTVPEDHIADWDNNHKIKANNNIKECNDCHSNKNFCVKCHRGTKGQISTHNSNFMLTHKYEARTGMKNCYACHTQRECRNCHNDRSVTRYSSVYKRIHPAGWNNQQSPNFHKRKARIRLSACNACHTRNDCYCHVTKRR